MRTPHFKDMPLPQNHFSAHQAETLPCQVSGSPFKYAALIGDQAFAAEVI
jgi:hypothetical protein